MKNLYLLFVTLVTFTFGSAQIVNIPDANFKNALVNTNCVDLDGDFVGDIDADLNNDGEIQVLEAEAVIRLSIPGNNISSLEGIQSFINLTFLNFGSNTVSSVNVQNNNLLEILVGTANSFTSLNVSNLNNLTSLYVDHNSGLTSIDLSNNLNLETFYASSCGFTSIDLSNNILLHTLTFEHNDLTSLDLSQNINLIELRCNWNNLSSIDVSQSTFLEILHCKINELTSLDVSQNIALKELDASVNQLTNLDVTQNANLRKLTVFDNQLSELDVSQNPDLETLSFFENQIASLDISQNPNIWLLFCGGNQLTSLNIKNGNNTNLLSFSTSNNPNLFCVEVDDINYANAQSCGGNIDWCIDPWTAYSELCELGVENEETISILISPNPVNNILYIETNGFPVDSLKVYSLQGQNVLENIQTNKIDVSKLPTGIYFIQITSEEQTLTKKFIKK